jgi:RimJ/RimL family protein N-acetyltransferase
MIEQIETERLILRPISEDDVDALVALDRDPEVMRYINGGKPTPRSEVEAIVRSRIGQRWLAFERSTGELVGWFGLRAGDGEHDRALGYRLRRAAWGQGFATEGSRALISLAFTRLGAERVWAETMTVNTASRRVMEHCGLRYVRTFYLDWLESIEGTEFGDVEYELLKADWKDRRV